MTRILVIGRAGQLATALAEADWPADSVAVCHGRETIDLAQPAAARDAVIAEKPDLVINAAAYTAVDKAESEPELAYVINAEAIKAIGEEAHSIGAGVILFSTDYVFNGTGTIPYVETDATAPANVYGASKLAGEKALAATGAGHIIFRTSWVYGAEGKNFLLTILRLARERKNLRVVGDQHGAPTWSRDLAEMTVQVIGRCEKAAEGKSLADVLSQVSGVYHASGRGETTWHGFASEAVRLQSEKEPATPFAHIEAITSAEHPTPAKRPSNSRLNCNKLQQQFGWRMMDWHESLREVLDEL